MTKYIVNRLIQLVFVLFGASLVVFFAMHLLPGDVASLVLGDHATAEQIQEFQHQLGLDQPIVIQYFHFIVAAIQGDLGASVRTNQSAIGEVLAAFPTTLQLAVVSLLIATSIGIPLGVLSGIWQGYSFDAFIMAITLVGVSMPVFWLGLMLLIAFAGWSEIAPIGGLMPLGMDVPRYTGMSIVDSLISGNPQYIWESFHHMFLPSLTISLTPTALLVRITRAEVINIASQDHVRTANAKGLTSTQVVVKHILRNALTPIVTVVGLQLGLLLSGAVLVETIFALPGVGRLMISSILFRDYPVVQAGALFMSAIFVLVNLLVDLSYVALDPRVGRP